MKPPQKKLNILTSARLPLLMLFLSALVLAGGALFLGPIKSLDPQILLHIRLPRVILAIIVGFGLAGSGTVLQGVLRNPLADPFILGTSSAAATGVMLASILGWHHYSGLYFMALGFAILSIFIVYRIAQVNGKTPIQTLILAGVIISLFFNAAVFLFYSIHYRDSFNVLFYLLGSLTEGSPLHISLSGGIIFACLLGSWFLSRDLNILTQGEETAHHLGLRVEWTKKILFVLASLMVAAAVAVSGMIGFVGLITPHMMRMIVGPDHRWLIPAAALGGAMVLILTDTLARTLIPPLEIPVGALTAILGAPYFIYLLRKKHSAGAF